MSSSILTFLSDAIGLSIALLYTLAGQAHFTSRFTPGLAAQVDEMTPNSHQAFWFLHLTYEQCKAAFGAFDLIAAVLLWRRSTRTTGLAFAVIGFAGGMYGQIYSNAEVGQVASMFGLAVAGFLTAPKSRR